MIKKWVIILLAGIIVSAGFAVTASSEETDDKVTPVTIGEILESPDTYTGQNVTFNGTISSQCGSGCWFILSDDTGDLYVTLLANNFVIPPAIGKKATVTGLVEKKDDLFVTGSKVTVGDTTYP